MPRIAGSALVVEMIFALAWAIPVGLLFLILVAIVFPRLIRGLFILVALFALFAWGEGMKDQITKTPDSEFQQKTEMDPTAHKQQEEPLPVRNLPARPQEMKTATGVNLCLLNGQVWMVGKCPPDRTRR
jgi:hypothetical protein